MAKSSSKQFRADLLQQKSQADSLLTHSILNPNFDAIIKAKSKQNIDRKLLSAYFKTRYSDIKTSEKVQRNIALIAEKNTFTITTGQQVGLFGGPLYSIHKAITSIKLAEELRQKFPEYNFIPIFWLASEDHDYQEVNHFFLDYQSKYIYDKQFFGAVGRHKITKIEQTDWWEKISPELQQFYRSGESLTSAFFKLFHYLFDEHGLLIIDADNQELKSVLQQQIKEELLENISGKLLQSQTEKIEKVYKTQAFPRDINFFYLDDERRDLLIQNDDKFSLKESEITFSKAEMNQMLDSAPEKFSPNVLLRPLYQELLLPNIAYVGGWSEVFYWTQTRAVFEHYDVPFPLILPRSSALLVENSAKEKWENFGFEFTDFQRIFTDLSTEFVKKNYFEDEILDFEKKISNDFNELKNFAKTISPSQEVSVEFEWKKVQKYLKRLRKKSIRSLKNQNSKEIREILSVKNIVQADGFVQERTLSLASFPNHDLKKLVQNIYEQLEIFNFELQEILI